MRERRIPAVEVDEHLRASIDGLALSRPDLSAQFLLTRAQKRVALIVGLYLLAALIFSPVDATTVVLALIIALYLAVVVDRIVLYVRSHQDGSLITVTDEEALAVPDGELPVFTVLVPAYKEPEVIATLVANLGRLEYPTDKLDVKLCLEADDEETIAAARGVGVGDHFELVLIPPSEPRTKPKACNYALTFAEGEIVTIYDAEDDPEPLQLRRAVVALGRSPADVVCLQAKLSFFHPEQNLITKWFTLEYLTWFAFFLPGLVKTGAPIPLGGTSNHFRRSVLAELGGWDAFNVTEDADLGMRLARAGYHCRVLDSVTLEEPNNDFINWVKQRSRWYKGYFQTSLIHLRHPGRLRRELGWSGLVHMVLFVLGTPLLAALNPLFWGLPVLWFANHPHIIKQLFPAPLFYVGTCVWIFGNCAMLYLAVLTCRLAKRQEYLVAALLSPLYWIMMAMAAIKAAYQLVVTPSFWEKTHHGLGPSTPLPPGAQGATPEPV